MQAVNRGLLEAYVRSVLVELSVDRGFVAHLRQGVGMPQYQQGELIAAGWLKQLKTTSEPVSTDLRRSIMNFAATRYPVILKANDGNRDAAESELERLLDLKFATFLATKQRHR